MTALMRAINTSSSCGAHVKVAEKLIAAGPNLNLQNKVCMYKSSADGVCSLFGIIVKLTATGRSPDVRTPQGQGQLGMIHLYLMGGGAWSAGQEGCFD